jgi:hypothetical protein
MITKYISQVSPIKCNPLNKTVNKKKENNKKTRKTRKNKNT